MELLDLNDDVLPLIFTHLHGESALNASLTCKQIFELAIHRVVAVVSCHSFEELRRLDRYLSGTPSRGRHIEDLTIRYQTYQGAYVIYNVATPTIGWNLEEACLVVNILDKARNLRRLSLFRLHSLSQFNTRVLLSIGGLRHLRSFEVEEISVSTMPMLNITVFAELHTLWLQFRDEAMSVVTLLSRLPKLVTLTLVEYRGEYEELSKHPLLPSMRHLRLLFVSPYALSITQFCPNLATLAFFLARRHTLENIAPLPGKRLQPLQSLRVCGNKELKCIERILPATIHHLDFTEPFSGSVGHPHPDTSAMESAFRRTSPIATTLWITPGLAPISLWPAVANAAPKLRVLTIHSLPPYQDYSMFQGWVSLTRIAQNDLPAQLSALSLVALTIHMPTPSMQVLPHTASQEEELQFIKALLTGSDVLPQGVADAIRTLRFVTLAGPRRTTEDEDRTRVAMTAT
ncbi:hypothetical protein C8Q80DRAFT_1119587 [Daedaleopsis nitida]|nr:hypothetical protein C8Q80DRAFT_1119587 [Daedaleopsis nitida]